MSLRAHPPINNVEAWKQEQGSSAGSDKRFDFIQREGDQLTTGKVSLQDICNQHPSTPEILVLFLPEVAEVLKLAGHEELFQRYQIPAAFQGSIVHDASGYFSCQDTQDDQGNLESFTSQTRLLVKQPVDTAFRSSKSYDISSSYMWHRLGIFLIWTPYQHLFVLCFGLPPALQLSLSSSLSQINLDDPFSFYTIFIEHTATLYDRALWSWRDLVREIELNRTSSQDPQPDYIKMHELARHIIHCSETLATAIEGISSLLREQEIFFLENSVPASSITQSKRTRQIVRAQITLFKCLYLRSKTLEERLKSETNLAFNTVAQHDSHIAVQIGEATQVDSAAMRTISVLGLTFLPGTFICALFSMSFFQYEPASSTEPQSWTVSEKFWVFWAVVIPVTMATVACWVAWQKFSRRGGRGRLK